jgi:hypothetical protein
MKTEHLDEISDVQKATEKRSHNVSNTPHHSNIDEYTRQHTKNTQFVRYGA